MRNVLIAILALASFPTAAFAQAQQPPITAMKTIGTAWSKLATSGEKLIVRCSSGGYKAVRFRSGTSVAYDLKKSDSLMNPYVGLVTITGATEENSDSYDGRCSPDPVAATSLNTFRGNDRVYTMQLVYQTDGATLKLADANEVFINQLGNELGMAAPGASVLWRTIAGVPVK